MVGETKTTEVIDLFNMTDEQEAFVSDYLWNVFGRNKDLNFLNKSNTLKDTQGNLFHLSHHLVRLPGTSHFILFDLNKHSLLGAGSFGSVYTSSGELFFRNKKIKTSKAKKYALKLSRIDDMVDEIKNSEQIKYLQTKSIGVIETEPGKFFYTALMRRVPGKSFQDFINSEKEKKLLAMERIHISLKLLYKLKEQIHQRKLVHLDIKPHNILITEKSNRSYSYTVKPVDLGLAKKMKGILQEDEGTKEYMAPEIRLKLKEKLSAKVDIYSLGVTLAQLWGHQITNEESAKIKQSPYLIRKFNLKCLEEDQSISSETKTLIRSIIKKSTEFYSTNRMMDIDKIIKTFHQARVQILLQKAPPEFHASIEYANKVGQQTRHNIRKLDCSIRVMKGNLEKALKQIDDNEYALSEFQYVTNIKVFLGLKTKSEFLKKMNTICDDFDKNENIIKLAKNVIEDKSTLHVYNRLLENNNSIKKSVAKLDNMQKINNKNKKLINANPILNKLKILNEVKMAFDALLPSKKSIESLSLKQGVAKAVSEYIAKTLTKRSVSKNDRAFSDRRIRDMRYILLLLHSDIDDGQLTESLKRSFKSPEFTTGFFGRSSLREEVLKAIKTYENTKGVAPIARSRP